MDANLRESKRRKTRTADGPAVAKAMAAGYGFRQMETGS
jgi:hypothetical protein